jgi:hypothetical protein
MFIGYPATETLIREAMAEAIGQAKSDLFFDKARSAS